MKNDEKKGKLRITFPVSREHGSNYNAEHLRKLQHDAIKQASDHCSLFYLADHVCQ